MKMMIAGGPYAISILFVVLDILKHTHKMQSYMRDIQ